jgi:hypothetical protein
MIGVRTCVCCSWGLLYALPPSVLVSPATQVPFPVPTRHIGQFVRVPSSSHHISVVRPSNFAIYSMEYGSQTWECDGLLRGALCRDYMCATCIWYGIGAAATPPVTRGDCGSTTIILQSRSLQTLCIHCTCGQGWTMYHRTLSHLPLGHVCATVWVPVPVSFATSDHVSVSE